MPRLHPVYHSTRVVYFFFYNIVILNVCDCAIEATGRQKDDNET
jgi:hypothetical protein